MLQINYIAVLGLLAVYYFLYKFLLIVVPFYAEAAEFFILEPFGQAHGDLNQSVVGFGEILAVIKQSQIQKIIVLVALDYLS